MGFWLPRANTALLLMLTIWVSGYDANDQDADEHATLRPVIEKEVNVVHVLNPGEREYLSPNLIGLQNIAMTYLPPTITFINVIDAYREIVNGVRYEILLNAVTNENKTDIVCFLVIIEKPWLHTFWGDKVRHLRYSNCSTDIDNEVDSKTTEVNQNWENERFIGGGRRELSVDEIKELEAQIHPGDSSLPPKLSINENANVYSTTSSITNNVYTSYYPATEMEDNNNDEQRNILTTGGYVNADEDKVMTTSPSATSVTELSDFEKKWFDEFFLIGADNFENSFNTTISPHNDSETHNDESGERSKRSSNSFNANADDGKEVEVHNYLNDALEKWSTGDRAASKQSNRDDASSGYGSDNLSKLIYDLPGKAGTTPLRHYKKMLSNDKKSKIIKKYNEKEYQQNGIKVERLFTKFQIKYNRRYRTAEEKQLRFRIFKSNLEVIKQLNLYEMGSAKYGITQFADMTNEEHNQRTGLLPRADTKKNTTNMIDYTALSNVELPAEFDWREKGVISNVKNQGNCGSCWAFSVVGNIEGLHSIRTGIPQEYSEQELLDCDTSDNACQGGLPDTAYRSIMEIGGLELESEYPYEARKKQCRFNKTQIHVRLKGYVDLPKNETVLAQWLITNGPISIGINANAMQFYRGGVSHPWKPLCSPKNLDHGVLIVGYGVSDYPMFHKKLPYWIIKNSWGRKWGEQGYYRAYRGDNTCGLSEMASSALLSDE